MAAKVYSYLFRKKKKQNSSLHLKETADMLSSDSFLLTFYFLCAFSMLKGVGSLYRGYPEILLAPPAANVMTDHWGSLIENCLRRLGAGEQGIMLSHTDAFLRVCLEPSFDLALSDPRRESLMAAQAHKDA